MAHPTRFWPSWEVELLPTTYVTTMTHIQKSGRENNLEAYDTHCVETVDYFPEDSQRAMEWYIQVFHWNNIFPRYWNNMDLRV